MGENLLNVSLKCVEGGFCQIWSQITKTMWNVPTNNVMPFESMLSRMPLKFTADKISASAKPLVTHI